MENVIEKAKQFAIEAHKETNHKYDGQPYETHLEIVHGFAEKFSHLIDDKKMLPFVLASTWTHDIIEDCRLTYNDVKESLGVEISEITYALTNDKGRIRKERAGENYYKGIKEVKYADFVKICDRLANATYSRFKGSKMIDAYRKENVYFKQMLYSEVYEPMWIELESILSI